MNVMDTDAIPVHIVNPEDFAAGNVEEHEPEHMQFYTVVVAYNTTGYNNYEQVLPEDPLRKDWSIVSMDAAVVICNKAQVSDKANQVANVPFPQGAVLPANTAVTGTGTAQVFVVATGSTPSRVGVFVNRRGSLWDSAAGEVTLAGSLLHRLCQAPRP
jgi:hypothetical protein